MSGQNKKRPVNLYLPGIRLPVGGVVSILHRLSGVLLVISLPYGLILLQQSLSGADAYARVMNELHRLPQRVLLFLVLIALAHHALAGIRHLLLDLDVGITRAAGRAGAWLVLAGTGVFAIAAGVCLFP